MEIEEKQKQTIAGKKQNQPLAPEFSRTYLFSLACSILLFLLFPLYQDLTMVFDTILSQLEGLIYGSSQIKSDSSRLPTYPPMLLLVGIGTLYLFSFTFKLVYLLLDVFVLSGIPLTKYGGGRFSSTSRPKAWAVVTGATDGIGREFALQLARAGFSIVLASRSADKLAKVATEIKSANASVEVRTVSIDFSAADKKQYNLLESTLSGLNVGVLINNVGKSHDIPVPFAETTLEEMLSISEINVNATLRVTRMITPIMVQK